MPRHRLLRFLPPSSSRSRGGSHLPLVAACALLGAQPFSALAQLSPYYLTATQRFTHDSNLFRDPEGGAERSDTISSTGLTAGVDQLLGRQRLNASVSGALNRFQKNSELNNESYGLDLRLDWETVSRLSGEVRYTRGRQLASFADTRFGAQRQRNLVTLQDLSARAQFGGPSLWAIEADVARRERSYSAPQFRSRETEQNSFGGGARYRPSALLNFGLSLHHTEGRNPNFEGGTNRYERRDVSLTTNWRPSGITALNARLSRTHTDHDVAEARDFRGLTGALGVDYQPSGRTRLNLQLSRETTDESVFVTSAQDNDPDTPDETVPQDAPLVDSRVANILRLRGSYLLTGKIVLDAGLGYSCRRLEEDVAAGNGGALLLSGSDRTSTFSFGASYAVNRAVRLGCGINHERRRADAPSPLSVPFRATTTSCLAQLTLQ